MKCPKCHFENREGAKFCKECGLGLELACPNCGNTSALDSKFCDECGQRFEEVVEKEKRIEETEGERKHVTILFSDLSGYTAMSEKLDPEELKEIMSRIFGEIAQVVTKYEGFIEKFIGDAVVAFFGVPKAHEDDPIRAIRVAREIHQVVDALSPAVEKRTGKPISTHTGINTGLVVTGEVDIGKGTHGLAGETINLASRLSDLAKAGEILVGPDTYRGAQGHFIFETVEPTRVKGKIEPVQIHKLLSVKERPITIHRLSGIRSDLIGRKVEISHLEEAVENLRRGKGRVFSICGDAGTGKSRLVEEFKNTLNFKEIQWIEGHAYAYSQNIAYFPLIDLLSKVFQIEEGDPPEKVRYKLESGLGHLIPENQNFVPYVGSLYSLRYPEVDDVSPEFWRSRLQEAILVILSALARRLPTIFFLEDLHWADPSFVKLLRHALLQIRQPAIVLCAYRPTFNLFTSQQLSGIGKIYQEIRLQDLSPSEAQDMLESLLKTETIPSDLKRFVQDKAEGNPFYLEELINALIESETLSRDNGRWKITRPITGTEISSTIHGLISGRLDRLEKETKRILQEASVIGRAFLYEILKRVTELDDRVDHSLSTLERLDLIRTRSIQPDLEYMFKHPLTQEVVYEGLLKEDRKCIHEQIALVMEQLFQDRLPEFYETLAFHFRQGRSLRKAVDYLIRSGEKSLRRYAVEESHQYFREAFELLSGKPDRTQEEDLLLIDLLIKWALVYYYRGDFKELLDLLDAHKDLAESLNDKERLGLFYAWHGFSMEFRERLRDSYGLLHKALRLGEETQNQRVIAYAWLPWTCQTLGLYDEGIRCGERAQEITKSLPSDHYLYFKSLAGIGYNCYAKGDRKRTMEAGKALLDYGKKHSNIRSMVMGHFIMGCGYAADGDFQSVIDAGKKASEIAADPFYYQIPRILMGMAYTQSGQFQEAEEVLSEVLSYCQKFGCEHLGTICSSMLGLVLIAKGQMSKGLRKVEEGIKICVEKHRRGWHAISEQALGRVYLQIALAEGPRNLSLLAKNIGFVIRNVPFASQKAEAHFNKAIEVAKEIGAKGTLGQAYLHLGLLHNTKGRTDKARNCISEAIGLFEQCEAEAYSKQAREALASLA